jgi:hypothetical protein
MRLIALFIILPAMVSCSADRANNSDGSELDLPQQGVVGTVLFWEGDFMPMPDPEVAGGSITPVMRTVYIFEAAGVDDVVGVDYGGFYSEVKTPLVAIVTSDDKGRFGVNLEVGTYSLFVMEDGDYYANLWSSEYVQPVTVETNLVSEVNIDINYKATF